MSSQPVGVMPLDSSQTSNLQAAVSGLSPLHLQWVSGYAAGLAAATADSNPANSVIAAEPANQPDPDKTMVVLYGSQTGNGEALAEELARKAVESGFSAVATSLADYKPSSLKRESLVTFVVSTHGEGDPPDDAEIFRDFLLSGKAPKLENLRYSVLALGDSSYINFCQTGREFDARLEELGAERITPLTECDLDYDEAASLWSDAVIAKLPELIDTTAAPAAPLLRAVETVSKYDKSNPFAAEVLVNQKITGGTSTKDVRHIELSLEGSGLKYEPGDSLAVLAANPPELVEEVIDALKLDAATTIPLDDQATDLRTALRHDFEITAVSLGFLREWALRANDDQLTAMLDEKDAVTLGQFVDSYQIIDVVRQYPADVSAEEFVSMLRTLSPRSYSISSSLEANPDEVHLTVAAVRYDAFGTPHWGAASTHLADRLDEGDKVSVFVEPNKRFRLPADDVPVVMIGPGTGVAPFRAFVEERIERGASGDNWLFFGDRNMDSDFLYQLEWQRYLKQGHVNRLDVAFSRDQSHKVYVQDRIRENAAELYRWIERGATIYVCGDAKHMAGDVDDALRDVLQQHGNVDAEGAGQQLKELRAAGRYQRDVY